MPNVDPLPDGRPARHRDWSQSQRHDQVAPLEGAGLGAYSFNDGDELAPYVIAGLAKLGVSSARSKIAAGDSGASDDDQSISRFNDGGIRDIFKPDITRANHNR